MNPLLVKYAAKYGPSVLAVLLAVALIAGWNAHERQVGALRVQFRTADSLVAVAHDSAVAASRRAVIDSSRAAHLEADTAKANARARQLATAYRQTLPALAATRHALDSAMQVAAQAPDSASQGLLGALRPYLAHADSSLKACSDAGQADSLALAACQDHSRALQATLTDTRAMVQALAKDTTAKALQIRAVRASVPGFFGIWLPRMAAFGIGVLAGRLGK